MDSVTTTLRRAFAATLLATTVACGSGAASGDVTVADGANTGAADTRTAASIVAAATPIASGAAGALRCPAALAAGAALPAGARVLGTLPATPITLSSATVTADAVATIAADLSGLAEVEPEDGPAAAGLVTQYQAAEPSGDRPYALICRYGTQTPPMLAQAALLLPITPRAGDYRCTTKTPQGRATRAAEAFCEPA